MTIQIVNMCEKASVKMRMCAASKRPACDYCAAARSAKLLLDAGAAGDKAAQAQFNEILHNPKVKAFMIDSHNVRHAIVPDGSIK